jgi:hypothetical protein
MVIQKNCDFIKSASAPKISKSFFNATGDVLTVQIMGDDGVYYIEGRNNSKFDWAPLAGINLSDFTVAKNGCTKAGVYEFGIVGIREIRARVESTSGEVSLFGQIISTEET